MTVVILSMAALLVVAVIAMFASRWKDTAPPEEEDPDRFQTSAERRSVIATTSALAGMRAKRERERH